MRRAPAHPIITRACEQAADVAHDSREERQQPRRLRTDCKEVEVARRLPATSDASAALKLEQLPARPVTHAVRA